MDEKLRTLPRGTGGRDGAERGGTGKDGGMRKLDGSLLWKILVMMVSGYGARSALVAAGVLGAAGVQVASSLFIRSLVDDYILPLTAAARPDFGPLAAALLKLSFVSFLGVFFAWMYNRLMVDISQGTMRRIRVDLFRHMETLPIRYFDSHPHGDIMSIYTNDVDTLRQFMDQVLPQFLNSLTTLVMTFFSMVVLDIPLTLLSVAMATVMLFVTSRLGSASGRHYSGQQEDLGAVDGYIEEMIQGQRAVKVFCHEEESLRRFRELNERLRKSGTTANRYSNIMMPVNSNIGNIAYVLCAGLGAVMALSGNFGMTLGTLMSFLTLNKNFTRPITQISQQMNSLIQAAAGAGRIFKMLGEPSERDEGHVELVNASRLPDGTLEESEERTGIWAWREAREGGTALLRPLEGRVTFRNVDFGYTDDKMVLHNIDIDAEPGRKIAFVGSTGAGKTTIINLINRFYDVQGGKIRYDSIDVDKIKKPDLRRSLGMILQDTHLFSGTVLENIRYGKLDASDGECRKAAGMVGADSFIRRLPNGYDTLLSGDGANLSQGQRQLLAIARAAVADPPVLIMDEATSSIDAMTERTVQKGMDALMEGRTTFVIAHRLSTVRNADCIVVLERGRIVECGSHDRLLAKRGRYYQLYHENEISR